MWNNIFTFFNQGWVGSLIGVVGVAFGIVGIFSYKISKSSAKPAFQKFSMRLLGKDEDNFPSDVTVLYKGLEVTRLTKTTLIIWNSGTEVLNGEDIVTNDPLRISFSDGCNILSFKLLKYTKEVNNFRVSKHEHHPEELLIEFLYLDPGDGVVLELLHDSESRYPSFKGTIRGLPKGFEDFGKIHFNNPSLKAKKSFDPLRFVLGRPKLFYSISIFLGLSMVVLGLLPQEIRDIIFEKSDENSKLDPSIAFVVMGIIYTAMPASLLWMRRKKYPKSLELDEEP